MPAPTHRFHPDAVSEAERARDWYAERSLRAALAFLAELDRAIASVVEGPERWPEYLHGTRRYVFPRFPFALVYRVVDSIVEIVAIAHGRRRPGYWGDR